MESKVKSAGQKSVLNQNWQLKEYHNNLNLFHNLLKTRNIVSQEQIKTYLNPNYKKGLHNPFLLKDMDKTIERLGKAIDRRERIIVFGDYDVDGISGTAILVKTLTILGANISYRLPHRLNDGYGISNKYIEEFREKKVALIITVDCGISCAEQITLAKSYGIDVIITDHHNLPENFPNDAYTILHPRQPGCNYPFKGLTGSGVAYKLASALITTYLKPAQRDKLLYNLLDFTSLGTVADLGPLTGENRIIVKYGLEAMQSSNWEGLIHLMNSAGVDRSQKLSISDIGFKIGPRINAAGRIAHPHFALQLLLNEGNQNKAINLAKHLEKLNQERQIMVVKALDEAIAQLEINLSGKKILIAWSPDWHVGILGLIASRMVEKYHLPAIILQEFDDHLIASFRSDKILNAHDSLIEVKDLLMQFGGHAQAAGFSIKKENLPQFIDRMNQYAGISLAGHQAGNILLIDAEIEFNNINDQFVKLIHQMEPFGVNNEKPVFVLKGVTPWGFKKVGKDKNHIHFLVGNQKINKLSCIGFRLGEHFETIVQSTKIDLAFHINRNIWNGLESIQLQILDFRISNV